MTGYGDVKGLQRNISIHLRKGEMCAKQVKLALPHDLLKNKAGALLGRGAGSSLEFMEYRDYQLGDDPRRIDWRVFGRTESLKIKLFQEEHAPQVNLFLDGSRSMIYHPLKCAAVMMSAGIIATAALNRGLSLQTALCGRLVKPVHKGTMYPHHWQLPPFDETEAVGTQLISHLQHTKMGTLRIFISDLLWDVDPQRFIPLFAAPGTWGIIIQIYHKQDRKPAIQKNVTLVDLETGQKCYVTADEVALQKVTRKFDTHQLNWKRIATAYGASFLSVEATTLMDSRNPLEHFVQVLH